MIRDYCAEENAKVYVSQEDDEGRNAGDAADRSAEKCKYIVVVVLKVL